MTLTRIVRLLWSGYDIRNLVAEYFLKGYKTRVQWNRIEECLKLKIDNGLILPNKLKTALHILVNPIGARIKDFVVNLYGNDYVPSHFMGVLSWTFLGIIDTKKTAKAIISDENLLITKRYEIACTYCLKDEILMLWRELSETYKNNYLILSGPIYTLHYLPIYWTYYMMIELNRLDRKIRYEYPETMNCHCFGALYAGIDVNQVALEYFIGKMTVEEKEQYFQRYFQTLEARRISTIHAFGDIYSCDITYFLLSQMNENQRKSIFQKYAYLILKIFLKFPYGGMFFEFESVLREFLTVDLIEDLEEQYQETSNYFCFRNIR
ncbi:ANK_REP_REGION domain-containing protein [Trichonephila clavata]|uniref:ANK_REP_REGION domain-containing protein n=1 Tax=Trichonephila clavata TaxID=2740835 RepID=A0A8X6HWP5_TRICU|nr:ANK_REP_REGION domain-containing protein [Trichonephila clavata]